MDKKLLAGLLCLSLVLAGCGEKSQARTPETGTESLETQAYGSPAEISETLSENHQIRGKLYNPERIQCAVYSLETVPMDAEEIADILLPGDASAHTLEHDDFWMEDRYVTESGYTLRAGGTGISLFRSEEAGKFDEIGRLNQLYAAQHPEEIPPDLDFMSLEDAIALGKKTLRSLGIDLELVPGVALGLPHDRLRAYQQSLWDRDKTMEFPDYDPFDNVFPMDSLTREDDCYYLEFHLAKDGIPVYGYPNEAAAQVRDGVFSPPAAQISMVLSRNGFQQVEIPCPYRIGERVRTFTALSFREALEIYREKWSQILRPDTYTEVRHIYLEYLPREAGEDLQLTPYWVFSASEKFENTADGTFDWWPYQAADRFNAETGADYAYGG